jgi:hypothetical protein
VSFCLLFAAPRNATADVDAPVIFFEFHSSLPIFRPRSLSRMLTSFQVLPVVLARALIFTLPEGLIYLGSSRIARTRIC